MSAKNVMKGILLSMVNALSKINQPMIIKDVQYGKMESAPHAPRDGTSMNKNIVHPSVIYAQNGINPESVPNAIMDILSARVNVLLMMIEALFQIAIFFVRHGLHKNAQNALKELILMLMESVAQLVHNVTLSIRLLELA